MATGEKIFIAKESTSQEILSNIQRLIADTPESIKRYGMRVNLADSNPNTRVEYMFDAKGITPAKMNFTAGMFDYGDWGDVWFVKNNRPVMVLDDGTVDYELDHENCALKLDGSASDIANTAYAGNAMSEIPLIWVKRYTVNNYHYIIFCETQYDDTYKAYAHTDADGNVLPVTYLPMYEGSVIEGKMRSLSGQTVTVNLTDAVETATAQQNGDRWDKLSFSECNLMYEMCTLISKSTNSQQTFGYGCSNKTAFLNTGTMNGLGQFYGYQGATSGVTIFYCENFFGNYWNRIHGLINDTGIIKIKFTPPYDATGVGYVNTEVTPAEAAGGYINRMEMTEGGRIPVLPFGGQTTFECDHFWCDNGQVDVALFGGDRSRETGCGLSCWSLYRTASHSSVNIEASLSCKPPKV